jgi:hypothetical protein
MRNLKSQRIDPEGLKVESSSLGASRNSVGLPQLSFGQSEYEKTLARSSPKRNRHEGGISSDLMMQRTLSPSATNTTNTNTVNAHEEMLKQMVSPGKSKLRHIH